MHRLDNSLRFNLAAQALLFFFGIPGLLAFCDDIIPDKNLEAVVRREVFDKRYNTEPITADDVKNISQVVGKGKGIKSLEGLQHCKALMKRAGEPVRATVSFSNLLTVAGKRSRRWGRFRRAASHLKVDCLPVEAGSLRVQAPTRRSQPRRTSPFG